MKFEPLFCPECGEMARGTLETLTGVANFAPAADGSLEYTGYTDLWWDEQRTVVDEGGYARLVCPSGHDWAARAEGLELPREVGSADPAASGEPGEGKEAP